MTKPNKTKSARKKPYQKPTLKRWGTLKDLTQNMSASGGPDPSFPATKMMCLSVPPEIEEHRYLVGDQTAANGLRQAIESVVKEGDRVIDLGAGTGILSFFALDAGASHVDAIEMRPIIRAAKLAAEKNGFSEKITFHAEQSENLKLEQKADVIISNLGFLNTLVSLPDAIGRLLKAGGRYFPTQIQMEVTPVDVSGFESPSIQFWKQSHFGYDMSAFLSMAQHPYYQALKPSTFLAEASELEPIRLAADMPKEFTWSFSSTVSKAGTMAGLAGYYNFFNGDDIYLSLKPPISLDPMIWGGYVFPLVEPVAVKPGDKLSVSMELQLSENPLWRWKVELNGKVVGDHSNLGSVWPLA